MYTFQLEIVRLEYIVVTEECFGVLCGSGVFLECPLVLERGYRNYEEILWMSDFVFALVGISSTFSSEAIRVAHPSRP